MTETGSSTTSRRVRGEPSDWHWMWESYVCGLCIAAILAVVLLRHTFGGNLPVACGSLTLMVVIVLTFGRNVIRAADPIAGPVQVRAAVFVAVMIGLWLVALLAAPPAVAAVPALYPLIFATLPLAAALTLTFLVTLAPLGVAVAAHGPGWPSLPAVAAVTLVGAVAAPIIGTTIMTTLRQRQQLTETVAELAASRAQTAQLSREAGVAAERERLAREIHDTLAQGFTSIVALAQAVQAESESDPAAAARHVELIRTTARDNLAEARTMVTRLTPAALEEGSLPAALRRQADGLAAETGIAVDVRIDDDLPQLGMATDVVLLRSAQEAMANVRRHARATELHVRLQATPDGVRLCLSDNGIGLPDDHVDGFGLRGMRARLDQVGGTLTLSTPQGGGVQVVVAVPA
ncbi:MULTISPECIES: sensor histidine kinase [Mycolicibacterium]|uniref:Histidine kinase n=1 Tax=Mycolicibacterium senegalense TaxID=1796 RepID=A0ABR5G234_9MYCO|nr:MULTISPECIES: sensor histidine kinase [Mycolicibacterium]KLI04702.1 histidine kinase [Mycolicibacterium senegalense]KLO54253.1 histidine kinase [Mycolicibacterium senegalense]OBK06276.1 two-component sensor histidine kinase [Mycolicibacterium conceptionense]OMB83359.1 two-component sensor histidine kinase [Mycolicibacterium conceptionense]OMB89112.1 two-component sensor histidine kinase [Mycolicibacterium conceptionense]